MTDEYQIMTIEDAIILSQIIRGVTRGLKLRLYPNGAQDADHPMVQVMRAFTYDGGGLYPYNDEIRNAYVWTSGITERWIPVRALIAAMRNATDVDQGIDAPMAQIEDED